MEIFKLSKSLGFTEKLTGIKICDLSLLAKWLREEHNIHIVISNNNYNKLLNWSFDLHKLPVGIIQMWKRSDDTYNTFEEAYEVGLQEALKLIDNK